MKIDAVCYVLFVETPFSVGNASIIIILFYNKYVGEQISAFVTSVASSVFTYLLRGRLSLLALVKRGVTVFFIYFPVIIR
jgi:hypothetical protein